MFGDRRVPNGEWKKIAGKISDAEVQYRPLFNDETREAWEPIFVSDRGTEFGGRV